MQRIEKHLVRLEFCEVIDFQLPSLHCLLEANDSTSSVADSEEIPLFIERNRRKQVLLGNSGCVGLSEHGHRDPFQRRNLCRFALTLHLLLID